MDRAGRARRRMARLVFARGAVEDTYGAHDLSEFGLEHPDRVEYRASSWRHLSRALHGYTVDRADVFLDYGCGKGRVVYQAAGLPFARVIGVEISPELLEVARTNIEQNRHRFSCPHVELVCADASQYEVPDDVTYVYMYNPFLGPTFKSVVANLERSLDRRPRHMVVMYVHPIMSAELERSGRFRLVRKNGGRHELVTVYEAGRPRARPSEASRQGDREGLA